MVSHFRNKDFLYRIKWILGERDKHPWGRAIGLKSTRVHSIFEGNIPQADALTKIQIAERVSVDWLLTGVGAPYLVEDYESDVAAARSLGERLDGIADCKVYVLRDQAGGAAVAVSRPVKRVWEDRSEADFVDVELFCGAGPATLEAASRKGQAYMVPVTSDILRNLRKGWLGKRDLLGEADKPGILAAAQPLTRSELGHVAAEVARYELGPSEEGRLLGHYRHLAPTARAALLEVVRTMDRTVDVMQPPPGRVLPPSDAKGEPGAVDREHPAPDKVRPKHEA